MNFSVAAAAGAFLVFNFHPARVFMGDAGSVPLGFLAGALGILGWLHGHWTWWFPLLVFSPSSRMPAQPSRAGSVPGKGVARASGPLLPAPRAARLGTPKDSARRIRAHARCGAVGLAGLAAPVAIQAALLGRRLRRRISRSSRPWAAPGAGGRPVAQHGTAQ
jgi:hypothetical protein